MSINTLSGSMSRRLDEASPGQIADRFRLLKFGKIVRQHMRHSLTRQVPGAKDYQGATVQRVALPEEAKAAAILRAYAIAGTVTGELTVDAFGTTPLTGHIAVAPNGDIQVLATDAITSLDIEYFPAIYDVIEFTGLVPATGVVAIPALPTDQNGKSGCLFLIEAEVLAGAVTGKCNILVPAAGLPATTQARLDVAKANVQFNNATDAPTSVRIKLAIIPSVDRSAMLEALQTF